jgi:hypothetical protein
VPTASRNFTREHLMDFVWMYDWLYPALTPAERAEFLRTLNFWAESILGGTWTPRMEDSDEVVGHYFGIATLALATGDENPKANEYLNRAIVGGLASTGSNLTSNLRNAVRRYVEMARGGVWIESTEYNLGTLRLLFQGAAAVQSASGGTDYFPEITRFASEAAMANIADVTPDLKQSYQWGDVQELRAIHLRRRSTLYGFLSGILQDDADCGPFAAGLVADMANQYGISGYGSAEPWSEFFILFNPYCTRRAATQYPAHGHYAGGMGTMFARDGFRTDSSLFGAQMLPRVGVDHEMAYFGDFQLYRKGEWAITHPLSYGATSGEFTNSMQIAGLSSMSERRGPVAQEFGANGEYAYLAGTTGGQYYAPPYWEPPATFLQEWTRSTFYLPSADRRSDTVVVFDRVNAENPKTLAGYARYRAADKAKIDAATALKRWTLHTPVQPAISGNTASWSTAGGQQVRSSMLLPTDARAEARNEDALWPDQYGYPAKEEQRWQLTVTPAQDRKWDTFLNVVQASDKGVTVGNTLVRSANNEAQGALISRPGLADALVLFGADTTTRLSATGYSVAWDSTAARTDLYILDLAPKWSWKVGVDGRSAVTLPVSGQGVARLSVTGAARHTVTLTSDGVPVDNVAPAAPTGLTARGGDASATLSWSANSESDIAGYQLYRAPAASGPFARQSLNLLPATNTVTQTGLTNATTYWYRLTAVDQSGNESAPSAIVSVTPAGQPTFTIRGKVLLGSAALGAVTITAGSVSTSSATDGSYTLAGLVAGTYSVRAEKTGYELSAARSATVGPNQTGVDFTAIVPKFSIAGRATVGGQPVSGVIVQVWGTGIRATTNAQGYYNLSGFVAGTHTVRAEKAGYAFENKPVTVGPNRTGIDFAGQVTFSISGTTYEAGKPVAGVTVAVWGTGISAVSAADGKYTLNGFVAGTHIVRASKAGLTFQNRTVTVGPSQSGVDFDSGVYSISGKVQSKKKAVSGATVLLVGTNYKTATTGKGSYVLNGLPRGTYTVTATKGKIKFKSQVVTVGPSRAKVTIARAG